MAFSTQKLTWGAAIPTPFAVGLWKGVDGSSLVASIRGGDYVSEIRSDVVHRSEVERGSDGPRQRPQGRVPVLRRRRRRRRARRRVGRVAAQGDGQHGCARSGPEHVGRPAGARSDRGGAGGAARSTRASCSSRRTASAATRRRRRMKRWNRQNELLADAAERASVAADWLGGPAYPRDRLRTAWTRFLWHQFHDDLTGTSIPQAYQFSWNDELVSLNQFAGVATSAVGAVASGLDTRGDGRAGRRLQPAGVRPARSGRGARALRRAAPAAVRVVDAATGTHVPAQVLSVRRPSTQRPLPRRRAHRSASRCSTCGPGAGPAPRRASALKVTATSLENARYAVQARRERRRRLRPRQGAGQRAAARARPGSSCSTTRRPAGRRGRSSGTTPASRPARVRRVPGVRVVEHGPARVALEVTRRAEARPSSSGSASPTAATASSSTPASTGRSPGTLLKASFPLSPRPAQAPPTTSASARSSGRTPSRNLYEVPAQQWADITDAAAGFGAAI